MLKKSKITEHLQCKTRRQQGHPADNFFNDLCEAFVAADIPFKKLDNTIFRKFLYKYTCKQIPDESTIRKNYLPKIYTKIINKITNNIADSYFWISADETTDILGRSLVNVIVGALYVDIPSKPHLIACKTLDHVNANAMAELILNSVDNTSTKQVKYDFK